MNKLTLHEQAVAWLRLQDRSRIETIAEETGLGYWWLMSLRQNRFDDPGVGKIERLLRYAGLYPADDDSIEAAG